VDDPRERIDLERALRDSVLAGDESAWRVLYERSFGPLWTYLQWRSGRRIDRTEEAVQECWLVAVRRIAEFDPERGTFEGWLRGIGDLVLRSLERRERRGGIDRGARGGSGVPPPEPEDTSAGSAARRSDLAEEIAVALARLPARYREVLRAKYGEGLPVAEIAARRGESPKAVESLLSRARAAFREAWRSASENDGDAGARR
jgi:RNA polymerase sigma-70 factor (ECF subfamily)